MKVLVAVTLALLFVLAPMRASAHTSHPTWRLCREHLDWPTATHVVRTTCTRYPLRHTTRHPIGHRLIVNRRMSRHVIERVFWPRFYRAPARTAAPVQPAGRSMTLSVSAYAPGCGASGYMASGQWPFVGAAAGVFPFGTKAYVPGRGWLTVLDRGVPAGYLDVFVSSCAEALAWGRRLMQVTVHE